MQDTILKRKKLFEEIMNRHRKAATKRRQDVSTDNIGKSSTTNCRSYEQCAASTNRASNE